MFVILIFDEGDRVHPSLRHSAWNTLREAENQVEVLKDKGYRKPAIEQYDDLHVENGHYFV